MRTYIHTLPLKMSMRWSALPTRLAGALDTKIDFWLPLIFNSVNIQLNNANELLECMAQCFTRARAL